jgi:integrase
LTTITTGMLQGYVAGRLEEVKPKTVINEIVVIKEMFKHAARWGYLKINPAEHLERPRLEKEEMEVLTPEEISLFLEQASAAYRTLFLVATLTGMRRGEIIGLKKGDIDWHNSQIAVKRTFSKGRFGSPKTKAGYRKIDMSPYLVRELRKHILMSANSELDLVFCNADGNPLDADNMVKRGFLPALRRAGVKMIRFQDLRHTNASLRIEQGQNIKYVQKQWAMLRVRRPLTGMGIC